MIAGGGTLGAIALNLNGDGTQVLARFGNTYTGATTITGGTLQLGTGVSGHDGSIAGTSGVILANNTTLAYNIAGTQTASYAIGGGGGVSKLGPGTLTMGVRRKPTAVPPSSRAARFG